MLITSYRLYPLCLEKLKVQKTQFFKFALEQYTQFDEDREIPDSVLDAFVEKIVIFEDHFEWYLRFGNPDDPTKCGVNDKANANPTAWGEGDTSSRARLMQDKALYTELQITGKLNSYLADLNEQAEAMFLELVKQMVAREGVTEQLEAQDQLLWAQRMNNIRNRAMEVVNNDLIYA